MMHPSILADISASAVSQLPNSPFHPSAPNSGGVPISSSAFPPAAAMFQLPPSTRVVVPMATLGRSPTTASSASPSPPGTVVLGVFPTNIDDRPLRPPQVATATMGDDRPLRPSANGRYDMNFFDQHNEYERIGNHPSRSPLQWVRPTPMTLQGTALQGTQAQHNNTHPFSRPVLPANVQRFVEALGTGAISDEQFDREFSYERLLALDEEANRHSKPKGLCPSELHKLMVSAQERLRQLQRERTIATRSSVRSIQEEHEDEKDTESAAFVCPICLEKETPTAEASSVRGYSDNALVSSSSGGGGAPPPPRLRGAVSPSVLLPCLHSFHAACIKEWLLQSTSCPICREDARI